VRVRAKTGDVWGGFSEPVVVTTLAPDAKRIDAPIVVSADSEAITLSWAAVDAASTYSVEMRTDCESQWACVTNSLKSPAMRKKNLQKKTSYFFRVKPNVDGDEYLMSLASPAAPCRSCRPRLLPWWAGHLRVWSMPEAKPSRQRPWLARWSHFTAQPRGAGPAALSRHG